MDSETQEVEHRAGDASLPDQGESESQEPTNHSKEEGAGMRSDQGGGVVNEEGGANCAPENFGGGGASLEMARTASDRQSNKEETGVVSGAATGGVSRASEAAGLDTATNRGVAKEEEEEATKEEVISEPPQEQGGDPEAGGVSPAHRGEKERGKERREGKEEGEKKKRKSTSQTPHCSASPSSFSHPKTFSRSVRGSSKREILNKLQQNCPQAPVVPNFKVQRSRAGGVADGASIKERLLQWCRKKTQDYPGVSVDNFSSSWADGLAFCALVHHFFPHSFDFSSLKATEREKNFTLAFETAEREADCVPLIEVGDMLLMGRRPDPRCVFTYLQALYTHCTRAQREREMEKEREREREGKEEERGGGVGRDGQGEKNEGEGERKEVDKEGEGERVEEETGGSGGRDGQGEGKEEEGEGEKKEEGVEESKEGEEEGKGSEADDKEREGKGEGGAGEIGVGEEEERRKNREKESVEGEKMSGEVLMEGEKEGKSETEERNGKEEVDRRESGREGEEKEGGRTLNGTDMKGEGELE
ncbi:smoothelin-like protein 1 [Amia ocellicauda]|uniref:smoothelin-like protein 1 n=1 Tax=Amia ocellicauda TaxID=2972642 RepID=UPI00346449CE